MSDTVEITGTLSTPYLPTLSEGSPWIGINVRDHGGAIVGSCGAQVTASPLPFRVHIDRSQLAADPQITLEAYCLAGAGSASTLATLSQTLMLHEAIRAPLQLTLQATQGNAGPAEARDNPSATVELSGQVNIPHEVVKHLNKLDATLLAVQEDGDINRFSSNLAEHSMNVSGNQAAFTLFVDPGAVPAGRPLRLHIGLYNQTRNQVFAGKNFRNLDLSNLPDLSDIVLKLPPR